MAAAMALSLHILLILALHVVGCVLGGVLVDAGLNGSGRVATGGRRGAGSGESGKGTWGATQPEPYPAEGMRK